MAIFIGISLLGTTNTGDFSPPNILISNSELEILAKSQEKSGYGKYLLDLLNEKSHYI